VFVQSIPKAPHKFVPVQVIFNVSTAVAAAGLGWNASRFAAGSHLNTSASLVAGCAAHLLISTVPVAIIISLTDGRAIFRTWTEIFQLSFPYYLASTGLASIAAGVGGHTSWPTLMGIVLVMFVTYRSYRMYFDSMSQAAELRVDTGRNAKGAIAGQ
jgi:hypothetical protein